MCLLIPMKKRLRVNDIPHHSSPHPWFYGEVCGGDRTLKMRARGVNGSKMCWLRGQETTGDWMPTTEYLRPTVRSELRLGLSFPECNMWQRQLVFTTISWALWHFQTSFELRIWTM